MSSRRRLLPALLAAAAALAAPSAAHAIDVFLRSPAPVTPVFGEVVIEAEVLSSEPVTRVELRLDDEVVARLTRPPWRAVVDVGQDNVPHVFEAIATDATGATATTRLITRTIAVDMQLDLELQQLYATVERTGQTVLGLPRESFTVLDEGQPQELVTFESGDVPLTAVLLVDSSLSMQGAPLRAALEGANTFVSSIRELDEASLVLFSDRLLHQTPFSGEAAVVARGLDRVEAQGGSAVNDHLYAALERLDQRQGRRVVILLSDGVDIESVLSIDDVLWKARRSQALVYWIRLREGRRAGASQTSAWRDAKGHERELAGLRTLVTETGGRIIDLDRIEDAPAGFRTVLTELRQQYVLGYYPTTNLNDGRWHRVKVSVEGFGRTVRTRDGYVDH